MSGHTPGTPLPWNLNPGDETKIMAVHLTIARADCGGLSGIRVNTAEANAAYIVHACNLYPELLEALEKWLAYDNLDEADFAQVGPMLLYAEAINATRAAIAKARGQ